MNKTITRSVLAALLSLAMILSLAGCGTSSSYSEAETKAAATESEFGAEPSTEKNVYTAQILDEKNLLSNDEKTKLLAKTTPMTRSIRQKKSSGSCTATRKRWALY